MFDGFAHCGVALVLLQIQTLEGRPDITELKIVIEVWFKLKILLHNFIARCVCPKFITS